MFFIFLVVQSAPDKRDGLGLQLQGFILSKAVLYQGPTLVLSISFRLTKACLPLIKGPPYLPLQRLKLRQPWADLVADESSSQQPGIQDLLHHGSIAVISPALVRLSPVISLALVRLSLLLGSGICIGFKTLVMLYTEEVRISKSQYQ